MKLNLGCGPDIKSGYTNVDFRELSGVTPMDLSQFPWKFEDECADEILMLDFLEHFPYKKTIQIINEVWRVLKPGAFVDIQVPDFEHCASAACDDSEFGYQCNACGWWFAAGRQERILLCGKCGQSIEDIQDAAIHRLYGGQDYEGNFHYTAFTIGILSRMLEKNGFEKFEELEAEHQCANWNFKIRAFKKKDAWG